MVFVLTGIIVSTKWWLGSIIKSKSLSDIFIISSCRTYKSILAVLLLYSINQAQTVSSASVQKPCREQPSLVGKCFFVYGRLSLYNGAPTIRLFRPDTKRVLGISVSYAKEGYSSIPVNLEKQVSWETDLWGVFLACPFTRQRPKEMQMICIEKATKTVVKTRR